jgi:hypothetical protein
MSTPQNDFHLTLNGDRLLSLPKTILARARERIH